MAEYRSDEPLSIRQVAELAGGVHPKTLKHRLKARERSTGEAVFFRFGPNGKLFTTLAACRRVLGPEFGAPEDLDARVRHVEQRNRELRRDLNSSISKQRAFQEKSLAWFKAHESRLLLLEGDVRGADLAAQNRPEPPKDVDG